MALLEIFVYYDNQVIYNKRFMHKSGKQALDDKNRGSLIDAILAFAHTAFGDELHSFSTDNHQIQMQKLELKFPSEQFDGKDRNLFIFAISDLSSSKKAISKVMNEIIYKFVNKYTLFDIINKNIDRFADFDDRVVQLCDPLIDTAAREKARGKRLERAMKQGTYSQLNASTNQYRVR